MSVAVPVGRPGVQVSNSNEADHRRQLAQGVNRAIQGQINCTLFVTLDPGVATTTVTDRRVSPQTHMGMMPQTSNAAAEIANGTMSIRCGSGSAVITHAVSAQTDRTFTATLIG